LSIKSPAKINIPARLAHISTALVQELCFESEEVPQDRQMLAKYAMAWNECALAFKDRERWAEAAEAFRNAMWLYGRLQSKA
jgi:hypothetical protein